MPWKTDKQRRWGNSPSGVEAMGQTKVDEFNRDSKRKELPEHVRRARLVKIVARKLKEMRGD
jgi:hypothetical protein